MNITFIGGGSLRILPIIRALLDNRALFEGGSIRLVDLQLERAEAVGRMIMRCPEFRHVKCQVLWTADLERGLEGADILYVTMAIEREPSQTLVGRLSNEYGMWTSDQLSANGAFLAARGGGAILKFARTMERCSPDGLMLIFANPVPVYSSMVNNHTRIKALGICEGFHNHKWDLPRLVFGRDQHDDDIDVVAAGVNHLSFILRGTWNGRSVKDVMDERLLRDDWKVLNMGTSSRSHIIMRALEMMQRIYKRFGTMIFSSELDSFAHVLPEETMRLRKVDPQPEIAVETLAERSKATMDARYEEFFRAVNGNDESIWLKPYGENPGFGKNAHDITNPVLAAVGGGQKFRIVASAPNRGAVRGFSEDAALEYTMDIQGRNLIPVADQYVPAPFHGVISSLSECQTLLAEAIAVGDPRLFADALEAYPMKRFEPARQEYYRRMLDIYSDLPAVYRKARDYFTW
jgi:alpha-galactosidase/6-phospho-beta-glucosidase family protein